MSVSVATSRRLRPWQVNRAGVIDHRDETEVHLDRWYSTRVNASADRRGHSGAVAARTDPPRIARAASGRVSSVE